MIVRSKYGVEEEETILKRAKAPSEAMSGRVTYATAAAILYAGLAAGVFSTKGSPQGQVCIDHGACHGANNHVVSVIEGPEAIVGAKGVPAGMCM